MEEQLKIRRFHASRRAKKLPGTKTVHYMLAGNKARVYFKYSEKEKGAVEKLTESNKDKQSQIIANLKKNYK